MSRAGSVKNKTKESLVLQHVRSSYRSGHSCQPAVLFEKDGSSSNTAAPVIYIYIYIHIINLEMLLQAIHWDAQPVR